MIRLLLFFVLLAAVAYGGVYLVEHPGHVSLDWFGWQIETSAALLVLAVAVAAILAWIVFRVVVAFPGFVTYAARRRRREKGYEALSRGLVAVHSGDARTAGRASAQASRQLKDDPLALMLRAQSAHLSGDATGAIQAYEQLAQREDTRILGLRGLHAEASRRGDEDAARHFAAAAHEAAPLPWSAQAKLEHHATDSNWEDALRTVEAGLAARHIDRETGERQRAVLETAIGYDKEMNAPDEALRLAQAAVKRAPDLAPAVVLAARLLSRRGDIRKASKLIEKAWPRCQHPDIAQAYLDVRPGDSTTDRLTRARTLMGIAAFDPVSRLVVARAALANTDYAGARAAMEPLVGEGKRPTVRMCLLMAELEEAEHGDYGQWREWLARASRAALDPAWVADGIVYDHWSPVSPTTGRLDAFRWQVPAERPAPVMEALPPRRAPDLPAKTELQLPASVPAAEPVEDPAPLPASTVMESHDSEPAASEPVPLDPPAHTVAPAEAPPSLYDRADHEGHVEVPAESPPSSVAAIVAMPSKPAEMPAPIEPSANHVAEPAPPARRSSVFTSG